MNNVVILLMNKLKPQLCTQLWSGGAGIHVNVPRHWVSFIVVGESSTFLGDAFPQSLRVSGRAWLSCVNEERGKINVEKMITAQENCNSVMSFRRSCCRPGADAKSGAASQPVVLFNLISVLRQWPLIPSFCT